MADELGIAYSTYQSYESDETSKIQLTTLEQIAKFYGLTLIEFLSTDIDSTGSFAYEPAILSLAKRSKNGLKVIVELDGIDDTLSACVDKLTKINAALA